MSTSQMNKMYRFLFLIWSMASFDVYSQTTDIVILNASEADRLKKLIMEDEQVKQLYDSIVMQAERHLKSPPRPLKQIFYEGLLQTNPDRIDTRKSLEDIDKVVAFIYSHYGSKQTEYARKAKEIVSAWASTYQPTGNPINENKLVPLFWAYYLFEDQFSSLEKTEVEDWMVNIAKEQMGRPDTPNNNWEVKRLKIIGTVGCIIGDEALKEFSIKGFKEYIHTAYYADGTSNDLKDRDALHYHISGLVPAVAFFVNSTPFHSDFDLFSYSSPEGASVRKSVEYTLPYATGATKRKEWTNSTVALDKKRAEAGLAEYQPGMLFDPEKAKPLFEWAGYYNSEWYSLLSAEHHYTSTWIGLLNSPMIRKQ